MAVFKCKMCGANLEVVEGATVIECEYCGTQQTLPKLDDEKRANLYDRANHFRRNNEFDKAMGIYESILNEDKTDAEAYWSLILCRYGIEYVEDPATRKRIPTINRAQFTSVFDDDNYKSALQYADLNQRRIYEREAKAINEIQKSILAISQKEEPFDVFICYKETDNGGRRTPDSVLAQELYYGLKDEGFKVFFSRITLEDKLGSAYEPYIFAALNSAKVMVVLGTKPEFFNAVWVKNEWSRYLALIKQGQKKMLIPAYKDMDPYDLPEEFAHLQAQDMSKLGFMQDLIRGIKKIVEADEPKPTVVKETIVKETVVASAAPASINIDPLLRRAFMFLEDGDWTRADEFCEQVLNQDPENAQAYLGKLMAEFKLKKQDDFKKRFLPFGDNKNYKKILLFGDEKLKSNLKGALEEVTNNYMEHYYNQAVDAMASALTASDYEEIIRLFKWIGEYGEYKNSVILAKECEKKLNEMASFDLEKSTDGKGIILKRVKDKTIQHFIIPNGVTSIDRSAFNFCNNLTSIVIPYSMTCINDEAFRGLGLTSVTIPNSVTSIGNQAFDCCLNLTNITFAENSKLTSIGNSAFSNCSSLTSITIPNGVTNIGNYAFQDCSSLTSISIPNSVTSIGDHAFQRCSSLTSISIPDNVTSIDNYMFHECSNLISISIPNSVTSIGNYAFLNCSSLTSITIPNGVTNIGIRAFEGCHKLVEVINHSNLPITIVSYLYGKVAYYAEEVHTGTTKIVNQNDYLFYSDNEKNYLLGYVGTDTELSLPSSYNGQNYEIYKYAFKGCSNITSIAIPNSVTKINYNAFDGCSSLTNINIPNSVTEISDFMFNGCSILTSITIPDCVTNIRHSAFQNCNSLASITIPNSVTYIGPNAFSGCRSLTSITIPNSVTRIADSAFLGCSNLVDVTMPNSVKQIGIDVFKSCDKLQRIKRPNGENTTPEMLYQTINAQTKSGCYVATCVYGSYDCPQVWTLRRYRDETLGATWYGRLFIRTYYAISPTLVKWFGKTTWFKKLWKGKLDRMVAKLQANGVENTPYQDKKW